MNSRLIFWSGPGGQSWVDNQTQMDTSVAALRRCGITAAKSEERETCHGYWLRHWHHDNKHCSETVSWRQGNRR